MDVAAGGVGVTLAGLTWTPARRREPVLREVSLHIPPGQRVLVAGPSGAGKSTLLRAMAGLLLAAAHGELSGEALLDGEPVGEVPGRVALLLQDPKAAVVGETVGRDIAFGLENARVPREELWRRVERALADSGLPRGLDDPTAGLSGGEAQRLALAGALASGARALLLDEPTAMLDPPAADEVRAAVRREVERRGCTLVVVEHRLDPWLDFADRMLVLGPGGEVVADGSPVSVLAQRGLALEGLGVWVPGADIPRPWPVDHALTAPTQATPSPLVEARAVGARLRSGLAGGSRRTVTALSAVDADLAAGRALGLRGRSGAGKSTLTSILSGLRRPSEGTVLAPPTIATARGREPWRWRSRDLAARLAWAPQIPEHGMVAHTVLDELLATARALGRDEAAARDRATGLLEALRLDHLASANPHHLSGGEQRRLMVAAALAHGPMGVLFDEPTVGQDRVTWAAVVGALASARDAGAAVAVASHDADAVGAVADDVLTLDRGRVVA